jgi:hypothetical protein
MALCCAAAEQMLFRTGLHVVTTSALSQCQLVDKLSWRFDV